jgi:serine/threonine-protein kinase SRPK3
MWKVLTPVAGGPNAATVIPTKFSLEGSISKISGEDKTMFMKFVRRMLTWEPKDRSTAKELLDDPWLKMEFSEDR